MAEPAIKYESVDPGVTFYDVLQLHAGTPDELFQYGDSPSQFAELWFPEPGERPAPVVAFIHGGCWLREYGIEHSHALATALKCAGYAVWNMEYRRVGEAGGGWPGSLEDIQAALELLMTLPLDGLNLHEPIIAGHSAGGHLALLATHGMAQSRVPDAAAPAVIGLAPIIDIAHYATGEGSCNKAAVQFMGGAPDELPQRYRAATPPWPAAQMRGLILMGQRDDIVPPQARYLPPGRSAWTNAGHFDWIHPGTPACREFLEQLGALSK